MTDNKEYVFTLLGTGAGCGVPAFFCGCAACKEAEQNPHARRGDCGAMVQGTQTVLIDTPPDLRHQLLRGEVADIDHLVYTHAHYDHLGGLGELEYYVQLKKKSALDTYASQETFDRLAVEYGYMGYCLEGHPIAPFSSFELDGLRYTALPVVHEQGTFGYIIETPQTKLFYASDTAPLGEEVSAYVKGADIVIIDSTFMRWNWKPEAHHSVDEAIATGLALEAGQIYLTHLAMHYMEPVTLSELEAYIARYEGRVKVAYDGLKIPV